MVTDHAWTITDDLLEAAGTTYSRVGVSGPGTALQRLIDALESGETPAGYQRHRFRMYDDDAQLYYVGQMLMPTHSAGAEEHCVAPLDDFGTPDAGCTLIEWDGKPAWSAE